MNDSTEPTPAEDAAQQVERLAELRLRHEKLKVHHAGIKRAAAELMAFPADHLAEALCQPQERYKILQMRKCLGGLHETIDALYEQIDSLLSMAESNAATIKSLQNTIAMQAELLADREGPIDV